MKPRLATAGVALIVCLLAGAHSTFGQATTGQIAGVVRDATGAVLPGATLTVKNLDTGVTRVVLSDPVGRYMAPTLPPGRYDVTATLDGFRSGVRSGIVLTVGREAVVNFDLAIGEVESAITVTGDAPLVSTTSATVANVVNEQQISELPLNGRSYAQLVMLQPGAFQVQYGSKDLAIGAGTRLSVFGSRPDQNNFLLDGTDIRDQSKKTPGSASGLNLGAEAVREFSVMGSNYNAEYGAVGGGIVNIVTRSGTNEVHGSAFEFHRNEKFEARNYFEVQEPPPFSRNQFGFSLGAPIVRERTFVFGTVERLRDRLGITKRGSTLTAAAREGRLPGGRTIAISPDVKRFLDLYPLPTPGGKDYGDGSAEFTFTDTQPTDQTYVNARVDHTFNANHSIFARYTSDRGKFRSPEEFPQFQLRAENKYQYLTIEQRDILSPSLLNVARVGLNRSWSDWASEAVIDIDPSLEFVPGRGLGGIVIGGSGGIGDQSALPIFGPRRNNPRTFNFLVWDISDALSYMKGAHAFKFGFNAKINHNDQLVPGTYRGEFRFDSIEDFLRGKAERFSAELPGSSGERFWRQRLFGVFAQDDVKVTPRVTLNLGVRYEFVTNPTETQGRVANLRQPLTATSRTDVLDHLFYTNPSLKNVAPRVGAAWDVFGNARTALRAGWGMYYDQIWSFDYSIMGSRNPPFLQNAEARGVPFPISLDKLPLGTLRPSPQPMNPTGTPTVLRYNLALEQELRWNLAAGIGYVGAYGYNQFRSLNLNAADPVILPDGTRAFPPNARVVNASYGATVERMQSDGTATYNALDLSIRKQMSHGLQFQMNYTFSKNIDDGSSKFTPEATGTPADALDKTDKNVDRGLSAFDIRHTFKASFTYALPFGASRTGLAQKLIAGWQLGGVLNATSGPPFTARLGFSASGNRDAQIPDRPSLKAGASNNPRIGDPNRWFDPTVFIVPQPVFVNGVRMGTFGNVGRNTLIGPGLATFDCSLTKSVALPSVSDSFRIQFKLEVFNLFNRANLGLPNNVVLNPNGTVRGRAAEITDTVTPARQAQVAVKVLF